MTHAPWREIDCSGVVIKAQDLLSPSGKKTNHYYDSIKKAGGICEYLGCEAEVILSSIMPDKMIYGFSIDAYADMIDSLQPDYYYTPDGETYLREEVVSRLEIKRVFFDTQILLRSFPHIKPIGLVKGCNLQQINDHTNQLLREGISQFVFHAGDYLCQGSSSVVKLAIGFACSIRKNVPWLVINGIGAMSMLNNFCFADGFVTQSHFVDAFYGQSCDASRPKNVIRSISRIDIMNNLRKIQRNVSSVQLQRPLSEWVHIEETDSCEQQYSVLSNSNGLAELKGGN
jgi:hypothetical protein